MIKIKDLHKPLFSASAKNILELSKELADSIVLSSDFFLEKVSKEEKLYDYGSEDFIERLDLILWSYIHEANIGGYGKVSIAVQIEQLLKARLRFIELLKIFPQIKDIELDSPIFICGLPRTGSTLLHNALSKDPRFRSFPFWESNEPFLSPYSMKKSILYIGRYWSDRVDRMVNHPGTVGYESLKINYLDFASDQFGTIKNIYKYIELKPGCLDKVDEYLHYNNLVSRNEILYDKKVVGL